jgi:hypothetical protein
METLGGLDELMYSLRPALDVVTGSGGVRHESGFYHERSCSFLVSFA